VKASVGMELGVHLPLMEFAAEGLSLERLYGAVDAARDAGFDEVSANDHFVFSTPWLDGPTALAAAIARAGDMRLATTISLSVLRGPLALAKTLAALDVLSDGRVVAGLGPGSSQADYEAAGIEFGERWERFEESVVAVRALLTGEQASNELRHYDISDVELSPAPRQAGGVPLWIGSWGSPAGLRRVARLADGWLASAYNTTPEDFAAARDLLAAELEKRNRSAEGFPNALVTMWTWVTDDRRDAERVMTDVLAPLLRRDPDALRGRLCVGSPDACTEILSRYAEAGCDRVNIWPLGDEPAQIERFAAEIAPQLESGPRRGVEQSGSSPGS
jgi:alkanesulfonate monooxygenase SsuD/methylene tetrahydromethanopterin reductase-like flavin-dependent oxidoreductase (luciferase family)